ncbi:MAG: hypothetical protein RXO22_08020 [Thermocladium sp.]|jgi:hypothetical protein|nr:MAG: hypothetical protein AT710_08700 [Thermocladium sp. ECH_B]
MTYKIAVVLDKSRMNRIRGTNLENKVKDLYGGYLKVIEVEVPDELAKRILGEFPRARIDARGFIEEVPIAFKKELFESIIRSGTGTQAIEEVLKPNVLTRIKEQASKEDEYLPPPK